MFHRRILGVFLVLLFCSPFLLLNASAQNPNALKWSTFLGGTGDEYGDDIAVDASGNSYIICDTSSTDYPTTVGAYDTTANGGYDIAITKLNTNGTALIFSTLIGGSSDDGGGSLVLDSSRNIYVVGWSDSSNFPIIGGNAIFGGVEDVVVLKLNSSGVPVYTTYLGGSDLDTSFEEGNIKLDGNGDIIVGGQTKSGDFPVVNAAQNTLASPGDYDAFVTKISGSTFTTQFSTYLGGSNRDQGLALATDSSNQIYAVGRSRSTNFPIAGSPYQSTNQGNFDAFVSVLNSSGSLVYSSYVGGPGQDDAWSVYVPSPMVIYFGGQCSAGYPTTANAYDTTFNGAVNNAFVSKLTAAGLVASTYVGGGIVLSLAPDPSGNIWITGETRSPAFPVTPGAFDITFNGGLADVYLAELNSSLTTLQYSTFLGGSQQDDSGHLAIDPSGPIYVSTGRVYSSDFPTTAGVVDTTYGGNGSTVADVGVTKIDPSVAAPTPAQVAWSTFIGGSADEFGDDIIVDASGNVIITGETTSPDYPTTPGVYDTTPNGGYDVVVTMINAEGTGLIFSTLLGGSSDDGSGSIVQDGSGNLYVIGNTGSVDFPIVLGNPTYHGASDLFVAKLNSTGGLVYSTYLGGSGDDQTWETGCIKLDSNGDVIIGGWTSSTNFPTVNAVQPSLGGDRDAFVSKISGSTGALLFSTYLGGNDRDMGLEVGVDSLNQVYVTGRARSADFPIAGSPIQSTNQGNFDVFLTVLDSNGAMQYSTYIGGPGSDSAWAMYVQSPMVVYLTGKAAAGYPTTAGAYHQTASGNGLGEVFVSKVTSAGLAASTFVGDAIGLSMAPDPSGSIWISGETGWSSFPVTPGCYDPTYNGGVFDLYVAELDSSLSTLQYSSFLGGSADDNSGHVAVDPNGHVYVEGGTVRSFDFPTTLNAFDTTYGGDALTTADITVTRINPTASSTDTDGDGLPNWWEIQYGTNPNVNDALADPDGDGLTNAQEYAAGTRPLEADADGDGLNDYQEVMTYGTDPFKADTDGDGISDRDEVRDFDSVTPGVQNPFNPLVADSTGDNGSTSPDTVADGANDFDGDGVSNKLEILDGTNPNDAASFKVHPTPSYALGIPVKIVSGSPTHFLWQLRWSYDGKTLAYVDDSDGSIHTVPTDGSAPPSTVLASTPSSEAVAWGYHNDALWRIVNNNTAQLQRLSDQAALQALTNLPAGLLEPDLTQRTGVNYFAYALNFPTNTNLECLTIDANGILLPSPRKTLTRFDYLDDDHYRAPRWSADGDQVTFWYNNPSSGVSDIYVLHGAQAIIAGIQPAPTSLSDPRIIAVETNPNFAAFPSFTQDGNTVLFSYDASGNYSDASPNFATSNFDIAYIPADGSGTLTTFPAPGNQGLATASPGGARVAYIDDSSGNWDIFVANLEVTSTVTGTSAGANEGGAGNDGINDVVVTNDTSVTDASGTVMDVAQGTVIDYPTGAPQEISVTTPTNPVTTPQLPQGVNGIPVVRDFGPDGTQFYPYIVVTITYTDQEIAGLNEATLRVFRFNSLTNAFDIEVPESDIVERDLANNKISFRIYHFSTYGLGGLGGLPAVGAVGLLLTMGGIAYSARRKMKKSA